MTREEKIKKAIDNIDDISKKEGYTDQKQFSFELLIEGKPIPYARARHTRFGGHGKGRFYNPRDKEMSEYKKKFKKQISKENNEILEKLMANEDSLYYVELWAKFYVPIQKNETINKTALKETGIIRPTLRNGDTDNYIKLVQDALHDVLYTDDRVVTCCHSEKYFSLEPRTEITVKINIIKE